MLCGALLNRIGVFGALAGGTEKFIAYKRQRMERADVAYGSGTNCRCELNQWLNGPGELVRHKWPLQKISFSWSCVVAQERGRISEKDIEVGLTGL